MGAGRPRSKEWRSLPPGVYARARNGVVRYYDAAGHALGTDLRRAALTVAQRAAESDYFSATWLGASGAYRKLVNAEHAAGKLAKHTIVAYRKHLDTLDDTLGTARLDDLRPLHVRQILTATEDRPTWRQALLGAFRRVWTRALETGLTEKADPSAGLKLPKLSARTVIVTDAMLMAVAEQGDQAVKDWCRLSVVCGQRVSDVLILTRSHIVGDELRPPNSKTGEPVRIAIEGDLRVVIDELLTRPRKVSGPYLIQTDAGRPLTYSALAQRFDRAARKAREIDPTLPHFQRRDLRAKSATDTRETAQARLGHTSAATTDRHYVRGTDWDAVPLARPGRLPR